jgi:hypothetical protein
MASFFNKFVGNPVRLKCHHAFSTPLVTATASPPRMTPVQGPELASTDAFFVCCCRKPQTLFSAPWAQRLEAKSALFKTANNGEFCPTFSFLLGKRDCL